jgi:hypothetical protein
MSPLNSQTKRSDCARNVCAIAGCFPSDLRRSDVDLAQTALEPEVVQRFPLLEEGNGEGAEKQPAAKAPAPAGTALDQLLGGGQGA